MEDDPLIAEEIRQGIIKYCPACTYRTQKLDGCNWVKCSGCKKEWCWVCLKVKGPGPNQCPYRHPTHNSH